MKVTRFIAISTVLVALAAAPVFGQSGWTESPVTINLTANMPELTQLKFEVNQTTLDLVDPAAVTIGTMFERSNRPTGYTVSLASANEGALTGPAGETAAYELSYGGTVIDLSTGTATNVTNNTERTTFNGVEREIVVTPQVDGNADFLAAGDYEDTLTFTISGQ